VIDISGLEWPSTSPFTVVIVEVNYQNKKMGEFREDTGGQTSISFDISSALRAIWSDYDFDAQGAEAANASTAASGSMPTTASRPYREYSLKVYTEYLASDDGGVFTRPGFGPFTGGRCAIGRLTEWERYTSGVKENADVSYREHRNLRNGDASTKPTESPERVGIDSITSWVDVNSSGTQSVFYPASAQQSEDNASAHAPRVLRDTQQYVDFLFLNRRGAVETCSGLTSENMDIDVDVKNYGSEERPSFNPTHTLTSIGSGGRRSWNMSSGYVTREWAEWWAMEFLAPRKNRRHWMLYNGRYVPVIVEPAKKNVTIYDRSKQQMPHVDFTVTLALEG
jgi:hypothetical protein